MHVYMYASNGHSTVTAATFNRKNHSNKLTLLFIENLILFINLLIYLYKNIYLLKN